MLRRCLRGLGGESLIIFNGDLVLRGGGLGGDFPLRNCGPSASPLRLSQVSCTGVSTFLGFFFFKAAGRAVVAAGMAVATSFEAVAMAGAGGRESFLSEKGK